MGQRKHVFGPSWPGGPPWEALDLGGASFPLGPGRLDVFLLLSSPSCRCLGSHGLHPKGPLSPVCSPFPSMLPGAREPASCREPPGLDTGHPAPPAKLAAASPPCPSTLLDLSWSDFLLLMRGPEYPFSLGTPTPREILGARVWRRTPVVRAPAPQLWSHQPSKCHTTPSMVTPCPGLHRKNQMTPRHLRPEMGLGFTDGEWVTGPQDLPGADPRA